MERERLSGLWNDRPLTLEQLDKFVKNFDEGCEDGQLRFLQFVESQMARDVVEIDQLTKHRSVVKYLREYANLARVADERARHYRAEAHTFQPMQYFEEFCYYCSSRMEHHDSAYGVETEAVEPDDPDEDY